MRRSPPSALSPSRVVIVVVTVASLGVLIRRLGRRSGATSAEVQARLPGDDLVTEPLWESTRAIEVSARPPDVWPWIVQMGFPTHRAGWYTPYWLDRLQWGIRQHSATRIVPELQTLAVGDRVPDSADCSVYFTVAAVEPERALVLRSTTHVLPPMREVDFTWAFVLEPAHDGSTRLVIRARGRPSPAWSWLVLWPLVSIGDAINTTAMLRGIKQRGERAGGQLSSAS